MNFKHFHAKTVTLFTVLTVMLSHSVLADSPWQLTVCYHDDGSVSMIDVKPITATRKKMISPGSKGALESIPISITWLNSENKTLHKSKTVLPLGIRVPVLENSSEVGMIPSEQVCVLRVIGPDVADNPTQIEINNDVQEFQLFAKSATAESPNITNNQKLNLSLASAPGENPQTMDGPQTVEGALSVTKVKDTGPDSNRLVLVFVGDGYLESELTDGTYASDVAATIAAFDDEPVWQEMLKGTNIYQINVASNQSGADYEDASPSAGGTLKDTYFNCAFWNYDIERLLYPDWTGETRATAAADSFVGAGQWDQIVMVVNSSKYGGAGGDIAINSAHPSGPEVSVHEVGHSLAGLADEYDYGDGSRHTGSNPSQANIDISATSPKWSHLIEASTTMPTPDTSSNKSKVGAFEGAYYKEFDIYRPWRSCTMRTLGDGFVE